MTASDRGFNIVYRKDMPIEETGGAKEFCDKSSKWFDPKKEKNRWAYTGFVRGNILGWIPIFGIRNC